MFVLLNVWLVWCVCSNAGKFVTAGGVIDVDIRVVDIPASFTHINLIKRQRSMSKDTSASGKLQPQQSQSQSNQCVIVTVSNSRLDAGRVTDASHMFIPFKSAAKHKSNSDSGQQVSSPRPPSSMLRLIVQCCRCQLLTCCCCWCCCYVCSGGEWLEWCER